MSYKGISHHPILISALIFITLMTTGCGGRKEWRRDSGGVWNTVYNITYLSDLDMTDSINAIFRCVELSLSPFNDRSLISAINRGESCMTDTFIRKVFEISAEVNSRSGGRFDPTVSPAVNLWKFGYTGKVEADSCWEPSSEAIDSTMNTIGISSCRILPDGTLIKKHPATTFNFSAVTKGYACDLIAAMLRRNGVTDAMIEIGGEMTVIGKNPHGERWRIQIDAPVDNAGIPEHKRLTVIQLTDSGIATSGNYRNYHLSSGGRVGHTIDPLTGRPAVSPILSATVMAATCAEADAYATAAMASPDLRFADSILSAAGIRAILVTADSADATRFIIHPVGID